ncbi:hypothetical protein YQE_09211, partial [Dendroctonus ponderosae]
MTAVQYQTPPRRAAEHQLWECIKEHFPNLTGISKECVRRRLQLAVDELHEWFTKCKEEQLTWRKQVQTSINKAKAVTSKLYPLLNRQTHEDLKWEPLRDFIVRKAGADFQKAENHCNEDLRNAAPANPTGQQATGQTVAYNHQVV